jgi:hypothetical protein
MPKSDHGHLAVNQFGRQGRQPIILIFGPTIFDCDVPALSKASRSSLEGMRLPTAPTL